MKPWSARPRSKIRSNWGTSWGDLPILVEMIGFQASVELLEELAAVADDRLEAVASGLDAFAEAEGGEHDGHLGEAEGAELLVVVNAVVGGAAGGQINEADAEPAAVEFVAERARDEGGGGEGEGGAAVEEGGNRGKGVVIEVISEDGWAGESRSLDQTARDRGGEGRCILDIRPNFRSPPGV